MKVHAEAIGIGPVSGRRFDADDPDAQLRILLTAWHSVPNAYERFGAGELSPAGEARCREHWRGSTASRHRREKSAARVSLIQR